MCGITGFYSQTRTLNASKYYEAHLTISHRGPDDEGFFYVSKDLQSGSAVGRDSVKELQSAFETITNIEDLSIVLGHRRLSIIDLTTSGHQPLVRGNKVLSFNGMLYNYIELKNELVDLGVSFNTNSDTEVFLAAYNYWGVEAFERFNGMWAAAIYDTDSNALVLVRDRFGEKPLFYLRDGTDLYFSSEIKFFKKLNLLSGVNEQAIYQYIRFSQTDYDETTFFANVFQVQPGSFLRIDGSNVQENYYWNGHSALTADVEKSSLENLITNSVSLRLRSDLPVGSLLSGGIDSSLILGTINQIQGLENFKSYSAVFEEEQFSEKNYIEENAKFLNFTPNFVYPKPDDLIASIEELLFTQELPFRSLSVLSQYLIYKEVSGDRSLKVLLNGQGADELFAGYAEHYSAYFWSLFLAFRWTLLLREFTKFCKLKKYGFTQGFFHTVKNIFSLSIRRPDKYDIFAKKFKKINLMERYKGISPLRQRLLYNLTFSALREYLRYEDRNAMAFAIETRLPFLDHRLVKSAFAIPDDLLIKDGVTKAPLRHVCVGKVSSKIIDRTDKTGFISPQEVWQRTTLAAEFDDVFKDINREGLFDFMKSASIMKCYGKYKRESHNDWALIWRIYCLYKWKKIWLEEH